MRGNLETNESDNLYRDEFFKMLKAKLKRDLFSNIFFMILIILIMFFSVKRLEDSFDFIIVCLWAVALLYKGWFTLFYYRFLKNIDNLDTPERLLYWLEKKYRYRMTEALVSCIILFSFGLILIKSALDFWAYVGAIGIIILAIVLIVFYYHGGFGWYRKEKDMIELLRELVEKK